MGKIELPSHPQLVQLDRGLVELKAGLDFDGAQRLVEGLDIVAAIAAGQIDVAALRSGFTYPTPVNYTLTVAELLALGHYDWIHSDVTDPHFPISGKGVLEQRFRLLCLGRDATDAEVTAEFSRQQCRDATNQELLSFGIKYPNVQRKFPIVQRRSVWVDPHRDRYVSYLSGHAGSRDVDLSYLDFGWSGHVRFLAVPQVSGT